MPFRPRAAAAAVLALLAATPLFAQPAATPLPSVAAHRTATPIQIDGRLDDAAYATVPAITDFVQQEPDEFKPATEKTEAWVFFDDDNIYVSARCWEIAPRAPRRQRDAARHQPAAAERHVRACSSTPSTTGATATSSTPTPSAAWPTARSPTRVRPTSTGTPCGTCGPADFDGGWTIEMAIPFKSLRYLPGREQTWGINLRRVVRWKNEWSYLAQVPRALTTFRGILKVSSAGTLTGLAGAVGQPQPRGQAVHARQRGHRPHRHADRRERHDAARRAST